LEGKNLAQSCKKEDAHQKDLRNLLQTLAKMDAYWRAANYLSVGQIYLKDNPCWSARSHAGRCEAAPAGALGHDTGTQLSLCALEPADPRARPEHDVRDWAGTRRAGLGGEHLS
jgi:hypothetical protein